MFHADLNWGKTAFYCNKNQTKTVDISPYSSKIVGSNKSSLAKHHKF